MCCPLLWLCLPAFVNRTGSGREENKTHFFTDGRPERGHLTQEEKLVGMIDWNQKQVFQGRCLRELEGLPAPLKTNSVAMSSQRRDTEFPPQTGSVHIGAPENHPALETFTYAAMEPVRPSVILGTIVCCRHSHLVRNQPWRAQMCVPFLAFREFLPWGEGGTPSRLPLPPKVYPSIDKANMILSKSSLANSKFVRLAALRECG